MSEMSETLANTTAISAPCPFLASHAPRRVEVSAIPLPRIGALLQNNNSADEFETMECQRVVQQGHADLADLDSEIDQARTHLQHLLDEKQALQIQVLAHEGILHSTRRLNGDVLGKIFRAACLADPLLENSRSDSLDTHRTQWKLAQVCRRWRTMMLEEMPTVWQTLTVNLTGERYRLNYILDRFLRRSAKHELRVSLHLPKDYVESSDLPLMLFQLFMTCDRWKYFHLEAWDKELISTSIRWDILKGNLPKLQTFSTCFLSDRTNAPTIHPDLIASIASAPSVNTLFSHGLTLSRSAIFDQNITNSVRRYMWSCAVNKQGTFVQYKHSRGLTAMLSRFKNLEECETDAVFGSRSHAVNMLFAKLHSLTFHGIVRAEDHGEFILANESEIEHLLPMFQCPNLKTLVITGWLKSTRSMADLITRSSCMLTSLTIPYVDSESTCCVLSQTPWLQKLTIDSDSGPNREFFDRLDVGGRNKLCPVLSQLTLEFSQHVEELLRRFDWGSLASMVQSRREEHEGSLLIQTLELKAATSEGIPWDFSKTLELQGLIQDGFEVVSTLYVPKLC